MPKFIIQSYNSDAPNCLMIDFDPPFPARNVDADNTEAALNLLAAYAEEVPRARLTCAKASRLLPAGASCPRAPPRSM